MTIETNMEWYESGACQSARYGALFFPEPGASESDAQKAQRELLAVGVCGRCSVREQCTLYAFGEEKPAGVWAGLTDDERDWVQTELRNEASDLDLTALANMSFWATRTLAATLRPPEPKPVPKPPPEPPSNNDQKSKQEQEPDSEPESEPEEPATGIEIELAAEEATEAAEAEEIVLPEPPKPPRRPKKPKKVPVQAVPDPPEEPPTELDPDQWEELRPLFPAQKSNWDSTRRVSNARIVEAWLYKRRTRCGWVEMPSHMPPESSINRRIKEWRELGVLDALIAAADERPNRTVSIPTFARRHKQSPASIDELARTLHMVLPVERDSTLLPPILQRELEAQPELQTATEDPVGKHSPDNATEEEPFDIPPAGMSTKELIKYFGFNHTHIGRIKNELGLKPTPQGKNNIYSPEDVKRILTHPSSIRVRTPKAPEHIRSYLSASQLLNMKPQTVRQWVEELGIQVGTYRFYNMTLPGISLDDIENIRQARAAEPQAKQRDVADRP